MSEAWQRNCHLCYWDVPMKVEEAVDAMCKVFLDVWGDRGTIVWSDFNARPSVDNEPWARVILRHMDGRQSSLTGDVGTKRYDRSGVLLIQIFTPAGRGQTKGYQLAQEVMNAFEDAELDVWFRNTRLNERGTSGSFNQIDVLTDFLYDEVR